MAPIMRLLALAALVAAASATARLPMSPVAAARKLLQEEEHMGISMLSMYPGFKTIFRTGDAIGTEGNMSEFLMAQIHDVNMNPIMRDGAPYISHNPDFTSLHVTEGGNVFIIAQFESPTPSVVYITKLDQDPMDGTLTPVWTKPIDFSAWGGVWVPCAGSVPPFNALIHGGTEEYEPSGKCFGLASSWSEYAACDTSASNIQRMATYFGVDVTAVSWDEVKAAINPYHYGHGWTAEIVSEEGDVNVTKWYTMGRLSYEIWYTMPDNRTVYMGDDGTNCAFYKFVMDTPGDLSSGTIYGAKVTQTSDIAGGAFDVEWVMLGSSTQDELLAMVYEDNITFTDIFEYEPFEMTTVKGMINGELADISIGGCPDGFVSTNVPGNSRERTPECLKLKEGMQAAAAFLETRRMVAYMGGTTEFSKFEGVTYSPDSGKMYTAMSQVRQGMEDYSDNGIWDMNGPNDVRLPGNPCGCVYAWKVDENYSATHMIAELCGAQSTVEEGSPVRIGECDVNMIAEPDNVAALAGHGLLIIGEDQGSRKHDYVWAYDVLTGELVRILSTMYGAETTSPYWFPDLNGFAYLTVAAQHPYGESDRDQLADPQSTGVEGWIGVFTFNASDFADGSQLRFVPMPSPEMLGTPYGHRMVTTAAAYKKSPGAMFNDSGDKK